jgi:hypothetical protein
MLLFLALELDVKSGVELPPKDDKQKLRKE